MRTRTLKALLIGENSQGPSHLATRLQGHGCECSFATSYQEACASLRSQVFEVVLSPMRLRGVTVFPLIDLLEGSKVTLFYSQAVEQSCWWLPALRHGEKCFGSSALRPSEFVSVLDELIAEIRTDWHVTGNLQQPAQQSAPSILVIPSSRRESLPAGPVRAKISVDGKYTVLKKFTR